jgi:hypothetical protein
MSTSTVRRPRVKPARTLCVVLPGLLRVTETTATGKQTADLYRVAPVPADFGKGFEVAKILAADELGLVEQEEPYQTNLDGPRSTCTCKGFCRWNHCRHVEALAALRSRNLI